jgi:hypothetical protein
VKRKANRDHALRSTLLALHFQTLIKGMMNGFLDERFFYGHSFCKHRHPEAFAGTGKL